ncbi:UNVERIFIED_CONTAM: hypothetical protein K2H54_060177 [Gekko kuhli]
MFFDQCVCIKHSNADMLLLTSSNVIGLLNVFTPDVSLEKFNDFYLVMPFMGTDLSKIMKHEKLSEDRIQFLVYQMLKGLKVRAIYMHMFVYKLQIPTVRSSSSEISGLVVV